MSVHIEQDCKYVGDDYWRWRAWIEGPDQDLDQIDHVVYILHPTFRNPVRVVKDRSSKFQLKTAGWGIFELQAQVVYKNGNQTRLTHDLELKYPDGTPTTA